MPGPRAGGASRWPSPLHGGSVFQAYGAQALSPEPWGQGQHIIQIGCLGQD